jgi:nucleotide-binding universal stress UspA family protein
VPRRVLIAIDFDDASVAAARSASPLLAEAEAVFLVRVQRWEDEASASAEPDRKDEYDEALASAFARVSAEIEPRRGMSLQRVTLVGRAADELLDFARRADVELIVAGFRRHRLADRLADVHTVAERLFLSAECAMLLVPEAAERDAVGEQSR